MSAESTTSGSLGCADCGRSYAKGPDLVIPDETWKRISPTGDEGGILCPNCIHDRLVARGLENVPARFTSGPMASEAGPDYPTLHAKALVKLANARSEMESLDLRARETLALCEGVLAAAKEDPTATTEGAVYLAADVVSRLTGQRTASALVQEVYG